MKCADIMSVNLECLSEKDTIQRAAERMADAGVGFLPICSEDGRPIGVVTDRDLAVRAMAKKVTPSATTAAMVMTSPAITCLASADIRDAEELMAQERKGRLVIVDEGGRIAGVLSLADLIERAAGRRALHTARAVLGREALGPRGGASPGQPLLRDDPTARSLPPPSDDIEPRDTVFTGGHRRTDDMKEFPS
jgi:CBS domain-containing protein